MWAGFRFARQFFSAAWSATPVQEARLAVNPGDENGGSVSLAGDRALVGSAFRDAAGVFNSGAAYVFARTAGVWELEAGLAASDGVGGDESGVSVALSDDRALVGATAGGGAAVNIASAYVFSGVGPVAAEDVEPSDARLSVPAPNPAATRATLTLAVDAPQHARATVVDALGRTVAVAFDGLAAGATQIRVDTSRLAPGVYVVRVAGETFADARRLTVAR